MEKNRDWLLHKWKNQNINILNVPSWRAHKIMLAHIILTKFKCKLFFLPLQPTDICASKNQNSYSTIYDTKANM